MRISRPYSKSYRKKYGMQYLHFLDQKRKKKRGKQRNNRKGSSMIRKILCFIGWHSWSWKYEEGTTIYLNQPPPDHAICKHCGQRYKKDTK